MLPTRAYDIDMRQTSVHEHDARGHGWCYGLPPGIKPEQWPLDRFNGFPLRHCLTLLLPEDYRCHGPDVVALSFFGIISDYHDGGLTINEPVADALSASKPPADPMLRRLWEVHQAPHPRLSRMADILDCESAVILLTQAEFEGPFCLPPEHGYPELLHGLPRPRWLDTGTALEYWQNICGNGNGKPPQEYGLYKALGQIPDRDLAFNRALVWLPRKRDPNAGVVPQESFDDQAPASGYQKLDYREYEWAGDHIGGTMLPSGLSAQFPARYLFRVRCGRRCDGQRLGQIGRMRRSACNDQTMSDDFTLEEACTKNS